MHLHWLQKLLLSAVMLCFAQSACFAAPIMQEYIQIPAQIDDATVQLEAMVYRTTDDARHPLIVINHGRSGKADERKNPAMVKNYRAQAETLAQKGFTVIVPVRRGYGRSEGADAERSTAATIYQAGLEGAKDVAAVIGYMKSKSYVDSQHILLIGQSCGGLVSVAATTLHIPGVIGAVNFAGGLRHSDKQSGGWQLADEASLCGTYAEYGKSSRTPQLWIYTENDSFFPATLSPQLVAAFTQHGGNARFHLLSAFGKDGHQFFPNKATLPTWLPLFDSFLTDLHVLLPKAS